MNTMNNNINHLIGGSDGFISYTPLSISTITVCFNFNNMICFTDLKSKIGDKLSIKFNPGYKKSKIPKKKGTDSFYNSFDIRLTVVDRSQLLPIFSNVSVFIFPNGKVKIAGIKTMNTINNVISELIEIISSEIQFDNELKAENIKIQMICSDFKIKPIKDNPNGWCIKQEDLKNILVSKHNLSATFSTLSRYPGINVKRKSNIEKDKLISLLIFRSGSIIITGAKHIEDIIESYIFIISVIKNHYNKLFYYDINEEIKQQKKLLK